LITFFSAFIYSLDKKAQAKRMMMCEACAPSICELNICDLPSELISLIVDRLGNKDYLVSFKETCVLFSKSVSQFYIAGQMVSVKYGVFTERPVDHSFSYNTYNIKKSYCFNTKCYDDSVWVLDYVWHYGFRNYIHQVQQPMNSTTMVVNDKHYSVKSHYCPTCFVKHVLCGSNPNVSQHYGNYTSDGGMQVNVSFNAKPTPSTWTHYQTGTKEPLSQWQVNALNGKFD
jgi:hypothetical protein